MMERKKCFNILTSLYLKVRPLFGWQSGSGKSTYVVDLLPRYHDVQEGAITIDGVSIKDVRIPDLRSLIGNVNQEAISSFNDTFF